MDSCVICEIASHLQFDDLWGHIFVEQFYRVPEGNRIPSVVIPRGVMGFIYLRGTGESIHPPLVLRSDLRFCWESYVPLVPPPTEKMGGPTNLLVRCHQDRQRFSIVDSFVVLFPE